MIDYLGKSKKIKSESYNEKIVKKLNYLVI